MNRAVPNPHLLIACIAFVLAGCRYGDMYDQPRYEAYDPSSFFDDGLSSRPLVPGVVPHTDSTGEGPGSIFATGRGTDGEFVDALPFPLNSTVLERGGNRFRIYCAPCHGLDGAGKGPIVERGFSPPPALFEAKVTAQPIGYYFDVISNGHGAMYGYAARIQPHDRWTVAAYLRALQLSQHAPMEGLPNQDREALNALGDAKVEQSSIRREEHAR